MAIFSYPFDGQNTTETQYSQLFRELQDSGVVPEPANAWQVAADASGMNVTLQPGFAVVRGHAVSSTAIETLTIDPAGAASRSDLIVLRLDPASNSITPAVVKGAGAVEPPTTQTDAGIYELVLAVVAVPANATNIGAVDVSDRRRFVGGRVGTWTSATRPGSPRQGQLGLNTETSKWEFYSGGAWTDLVPGTITTRITNVESAVNAATPNKTPNTLVKRDSAGKAAFEGLTISAPPLVATDAVSKEYADTLVQTVFASTIGGGAVTTAPALAANPCTITLPVGTWDIDYRAKILYSVTTVRMLRAHVYVGGSEYTQTEAASVAGGSYSVTLNDFIRITVSAPTVIQIRTSMNRSDDSASNAGHGLRARRVPDGITPVTTQ